MPSTASRLLLLLSLLQSRRDWPGEVLAGRLEISHRTVRRDVERLREMGYSIRAVKGPHGGYRLDAGAELPPLLFDDEQVIALAVALRTATQAGAGIEEAAARALTTVRQVMPARLRHRLDAFHLSAVPFRTGRDRQVSPEVLLALSAAIRAREVLRFDYTGQRRRAEPHHLVASHGRWYLVAWDLDRSDWRIFRADRMTPRFPAGPRFSFRTVPGGSVQGFLAARFRGVEESRGPDGFGGAGGARAADGPRQSDDGWPCRGTAILSLPAAAVVPFAGEDSVEVLDEDHCRLAAGSWSWEALAASFGRFSTEVQDPAPPELAAAFGRLAVRFAAAAGRDNQSQHVRP